MILNNYIMILNYWIENDIELYNKYIMILNNYMSHETGILGWCSAGSLLPHGEKVPL